MLKLKHSDEFQVWTLKIDPNTKARKIIATDGEHKIGGQDVRYWETYIEAVTVIIYKKVVYLPSEYEGLDFPLYLERGVVDRFPLGWRNRVLVKVAPSLIRP